MGSVSAPIDRIRGDETVSRLETPSVRSSSGSGAEAGPLLPRDGFGAAPAREPARVGGAAAPSTSSEASRAGGVRPYRPPHLQDLAAFEGGVHPRMSLRFTDSADVDSPGLPPRGTPRGAPGGESVPGTPGEGASHRASAVPSVGHSRRDSAASAHVGRIRAEDSAADLASEGGLDTSVDLTPQASVVDLTTMHRDGDGADYMPYVRLGFWAEVGGRPTMEDATCLLSDLAALLPVRAPVPASWAVPFSEARAGADGAGELGPDADVSTSMLSQGPLSDDGAGAEGSGAASQAGGERAPPRCFAAVFDGHNGDGAARYAADALAGHLVRSPHFPADMGGALRGAFERTDEELREASRGEPDEAVAGTTGLACVVWGSTLWLANCGDCRAVLSRRGRAVPLTVDHKPVQASERARIERLGGHVSSEGFLNSHIGVSRALGDWHMVEKQEGMILGRPEVSSVALQAENDFLILACDGLWDVMDSRRAVEQAKIFLRSSWDPEACARHLALEACARGTTDNVSVVVATLRASPFKAPLRHRSAFMRSGSYQVLAAVLSEARLAPTTPPAAEGPAARPRQALGSQDEERPEQPGRPRGRAGAEHIQSATAVGKRARWG